ncbi:MAG: hypothetical protein IPM35_30290 [Myxococcales bacterium]|nr:hypothetical protein [Myxococcales bacterium]
MSQERAPASSSTLRVAAAVAILFGIASVVSGGRVLLDVGAARAEAGAYVPFVLWFNFVAGFAYVAAGAGLWLGRAWGARLSLTLAGLTALTYAAFGVHVALGGAFEGRTVVAMAVRTALWTLIAVLACKQLQSSKERA